MKAFKKKLKKKYEISDNRKVLIGVLGNSLSFIFVIMALFFEMQNQIIEFVIFLLIALWLFSISMAINFTKLIFKSFLYSTIIYLLLLLPFFASIPFFMNGEKNFLITLAFIDFFVGITLGTIFAYFILIYPKKKKLQFLSKNQNLIRQSNEIQTTYKAIFFNEKGDRACIIKVNSQKFIARIEKLIEGGYYVVVIEYAEKSFLNSKVVCYKELIFLNQDCRKNLELNLEEPKSKKLKNLMLFFNDELKKDGIDGAFLTNPPFSTFYGKEFIYLDNKKDKEMSIEIFEDLDNLYFCLLGIREILPNNIRKEEIYEIIKLILQGKLIYVLNTNKTMRENSRIYDVYDLRKLNNVPIFIKLKILQSKNSKTWTGVTAKQYFRGQVEEKKIIYDIANYCDELNKRLAKNQINETFIVQKKLLSGKLRKCLHVSSKTNLTKQTDIYFYNNLIKFKFIFSFVTAPLLLDFDANIQIMLDFVSQLFLDKVIFHYKTTENERMYEKGMFLLDKNNEFKASIINYLQKNPTIKLLVWSDLDMHTIQYQISETFK